jgi:hypothetical protein
VRSKNWGSGLLVVKVGVGWAKRLLKRQVIHRADEEEEVDMIQGSFINYCIFGGCGREAKT